MEIAWEVKSAFVWYWNVSSDGTICKLIVFTRGEGLDLTGLLSLSTVENRKLFLWSIIILETLKFQSLCNCSVIVICSTKIYLVCHVFTSRHDRQIKPNVFLEKHFKGIDINKTFICHFDSSVKSVCRSQTKKELLYWCFLKDSGLE